MDEANVTLVLGEQASERLAHTVPVDLHRSHIAEAVEAASGNPIELMLDVETREVDAASDIEPTRRTLALAWDPADLERLLAQSEGPEVRLMIEGVALRDALLAPDVEAHGLREKLIVFATVAAVAAGGTSAASASMMQTGDLPGGTSSTMPARDMPADSQRASMAGVADVTSARDLPADSQAASLAGVDTMGSEARDLPADSQAASLAGGASGLDARDLPADSQAASLAGVDTMGSEARDLPADSQAASLAGAASGLEARDLPADSQAASLAGAASGLEARDLPADSQAASLAGAQSAASSTAGSDDSALPSPGTLVIIGGIALLIVGAAFRVTQRTKPSTA